MRGMDQMTFGLDPLPKKTDPCSTGWGRAEQPLGCVPEGSAGRCAERIRGD